MIQLDEGEPNRFNTSLTMFLSIRDSALEYIQEIENAVSNETARIKAARSLSSIPPDSLSPAPHDSKGKGRIDPFPEQTRDDSGEGNDDDDIYLDYPSADVKHDSFRLGLINRLREAQIILHQIHFLLGDLNHTLHNPSEETEFYQAAETLRRSLLEKFVMAPTQDSISVS